MQMRKKQPELIATPTEYPWVIKNPEYIYKKNQKNQWHIILVQYSVPIVCATVERNVIKKFNFAFWNVVGRGS